jgi:tRNA (guanosine-2'-O-)-methyltransferase
MQKQIATLSPTKKAALIDYLKTFVTQNKQAHIERILPLRTRYLTAVLENIYQPHNASAVIRSCECFGIQDLHIIENSNTFSTSKGVVLGSAKWMSLHRYNQEEENTQTCLEQLKQQGYKLVATTLQPGSKPIHEIDLSQKTALLFGTEEHGLSDTAHQLADEMAYIPMVGFTQSLNISVSAAICLETLSHKLRQSQAAWPLSDEEKLDLSIDWLTLSAQNGRAILLDWLRKL